MDDQAYLIFELNHSRYGIATSAVQELFFLPEITPIAEAASSVVGVINLRGEILPIVDLHRQLGQKSPPYQLNDSVIVLEWQGMRVGVIVNQVWQVQTIASAQISAGSAYRRSPETSHQRCVIGMATLEETLVTLLNPKNLVQCSSPLDSANPADQNGNAAHVNGNPVSPEAAIEEREAIDLYAHLSSEAQQRLRERSHSLRRSLDMSDSTGLMPLAVMGLGGEYFGLELEIVHAFTNVHKVTPIPCCPPHIIGNMNLRGEIVTLIDISSVINLTSDRQQFRQKAIVVRLHELAAGIAVDDIFDVVYVHPTQISPAPVAIHSIHNEYLQGVTPYGGKMMSIINLPKILISGALVVNEEV